MSMSVYKRTIEAKFIFIPIIIKVINDGYFNNFNILSQHFINDRWSRWIRVMFNTRDSSFFIHKDSWNYNHFHFKRIKLVKKQKWSRTYVKRGKFLNRATSMTKVTSMIVGRWSISGVAKHFLVTIY